MRAMHARCQRVPRKQRAKCVLSCPHRRRIRAEKRRRTSLMVVALSQSRAESRPGACLHLQHVGVLEPSTCSWVHSGVNVLWLHVRGTAASPCGVELWLFDHTLPACNNADVECCAQNPLSERGTRRSVCTMYVSSSCLAAALVCLMRLCLGFLFFPSQWLSPRACPALLCTSSCESATRSW